MSQKRISDFFTNPPDPAKRPRETPRGCVPATGQQQQAAEGPGGPRPRPPSPAPPPAPGASQEEAISCKPPQDYNFPAKKLGENFTRSCKAAWFREWPWLEYIAVSDGIVCGVCRSAVKRKLVGSEQADSPFLKDTGFSNWRKAKEKIRDHEKTRIHLDATQRLAALKTTPINALLSEAAAKEQITARKMLELVFSSVRFLGRQGLPLRGAANRDGVLWQLVVERVRADPDLQNWMKRRDNWMSGSIQNEVLELFAHDIQRKIGAKASESPFFGLTADGTTDVSGKEQFSCSIQFADDNLEVQNFFLGFYNAPDTTAEMLFLCIKDVLVRLNLPLEKLKGYCFDGASNMSGRFKGVQARLKETCPDSLFVHCANHSLDLVLQEVAKEVRLVADTLNFVREVTVVINDSAKRKTLYQSLFGCGEVINLLALCPTRWCVRVVALSRLLACYGEMLQTFRTLESDRIVKGETRAKVAGLLKKGTTTRTVFGLFACVTMFTPCESVARSLQGTKVTALGSMEAAKLLCQRLNTLRQDDTFADLVAKTKQYTERYNLKPPHPVRTSKTPARFRHTAEEEERELENEDAFWLSALMLCALLLCALGAHAEDAPTDSPAAGDPSGEEEEAGPSDLLSTSGVWDLILGSTRRHQKEFEDEFHNQVKYEFLEDYKVSSLPERCPYSNFTKEACLQTMVQGLQIYTVLLRQVEKEYPNSLICAEVRTYSGQLIDLIKRKMRNPGQVTALTSSQEVQLLNELDNPNTFQRKMTAHNILRQLHYFLLKGKRAITKREKIRGTMANDSLGIFRIL